MDGFYTMRQKVEVKYLWAYVGVCALLLNEKNYLYSAP